MEFPSLDALLPGEEGGGTPQRDSGGNTITINNSSTYIPNEEGTIPFCRSHPIRPSIYPSIHPHIHLSRTFLIRIRIFMYIPSIRPSIHPQQQQNNNSASTHAFILYSSSRTPHLLIDPNPYPLPLPHPRTTPLLHI